MRKYSLGWAKDILKELLDLVDVSLDLTVEGDEGRVCSRGQVLEVCRLPGREAAQLQWTEVNQAMQPITFLYNAWDTRFIM